ncbi:S41 family peptidase [Bdellovibrio sp. SKB1291214]|uniref:S41 family peptidase n=1 Tax=Bdellovibrio sp. SKB1291214 TaxID=1732569 RepID=UPI0020CCD5DA|nr:S41 family peptidase [Bdellovibrio sp. SKB1291214]UYL09587.1 S41 family peptidase [Bdellovibrio sp. SKB1291214]
MLKRIAAIIFTMACAYGAFHLTMNQSFVNPYPVVCDLVLDKIYLPNKEISGWHRKCMERAELVTPYTKKNLILRDINNTLSLLQVSHLEIYDAPEVRGIWRGEVKETGLSGEFVDSELVIFKVLPQSPAERLGFKKGDIIVTINGEQPSSWAVESEAGDYQIHRGQEVFTIKLHPGVVKRNENMQISKLSERSALLEVPSFRAEFFTDEKVKKVSQELKKYQSVVVDLRNNAGGNFVAGLRFLSLFICEPTLVGKLEKPKSNLGKAEMPDILNDEKQLEILEKSREVNLRTFRSPSCFAGNVKVLVDGRTSSVAEMVSQALKEYRGAPLRGAPSRGQLLVGVWYPMDEVGQGVQISIPEALYISGKGHRIEGHGVQLDKVLYYNLPQMQAGIDSWVKSFQD